MLSRFQLLLLTALPALVSATTVDSKYFQQQVEPILRDHCYKCHSHSSDKIKGGLVLDSRDAALTGGDTGPAIVPGNLEKSLLIEAIRYQNEDLQMPPKGKKLTDEQIVTLTEWVKAGAPWAEEKDGKVATRPKGKITDEDRRWWAFQPMARPALPPDDPWCANEIDRFVLARLKSENLQPAPEATPTQLIRRITQDLTGLPPTPEQVAAASESTMERLVSQLLASPSYGERWARHWLDLVRYAESDGYRVDDYRPHAWRFRDYVIRSLNADKPYDRFVQEQLAGDELWPDDIDARIATGYLCHWIYEYNSRDAATQWSTIMNDITDTTADVFLGLGVQCARCHDHKFDPILQKDYFRLQAFFAPLRFYAEGEIATPAEREAFAKNNAEWETRTADIRAKLDEVEAPYIQKAEEEAVAKFPPETRAMIAKSPSKRTPYEQQIAELAWRQVEYEWSDKRFPARVKEPDKSRRSALLAELAKFAKDKPEPLPIAMQAVDLGTGAPPITIPKKQALGEIAPGVLSVLDEAPAAVTPLANSTGRRTAFARWLTQPKNPLTARVIVNRVWQYHFGRGLAVNASDFGKLGEAPSHPELLDWLACWFVENGWSLKKLHRLILTSATYRQSTINPIAEKARIKDPENILLWRGNTHRLDAEQIRDAFLMASGELKSMEGGPGQDAKSSVRSIFTKVIRNTRDPVLDVFDAPEGFTSTSLRNTTTTPTQSLLMINSKWTIERARAFASRLRGAGSTSIDEIISSAYRIAYGRVPSPHERDSARAFVEHQAAMFAARKPSAVTAPFAWEKMPFRDGRAALFTPGGQDRLTIAEPGAMPTSDFTIEAFINIRSIYEDARVRTIVASGDGLRGHPGWSIGVTGKTSRHKPQTLVLLLSGDQPWKPEDPIEPVFSGLHIELGKTYFIAVSVKLDDATEKGITFYAKDLSNDDEPLQAVNSSHQITSGIAPAGSFVLGGRGTQKDHLFDGLIDDVRLSNAALRPEQLLFTSAASAENTVGYWKFETDPGPFKDSSSRARDIATRTIEAPREDPQTAALTDFCHVILNSNEFLYVD